MIPLHCFAGQYAVYSPGAEQHLFWRAPVSQLGWRPSGQPKGRQPAGTTADPRNLNASNIKNLIGALGMFAHFHFEQDTPTLDF